MRFLLIGTTPPYPAITGNGQRTALICRALQEIGEVDLLLLCDPDQIRRDALDVLRASFGRVTCLPMPRQGERPGWQWIRPLWPDVVDRLAYHLGRHETYYRAHHRIASVLAEAVATRQYDLIVSRYVRSAVMSGALSFSPLILDVDDLDHSALRWRLNATATRRVVRPVLRYHLRQLERIVPPLIARCDRLWVTNERDLAEMDGLPATLLPNIPFAEPGEPGLQRLPPNPESRVILTVASLMYRPNIEGINYFLQRVWPAVRQGVPDAVFRIVGSNLSPALRKQWARIPGVEPIGFVEDLKQAYAPCAFTVAPVFHGGGTNIKVLESLAYGRACVVTPFAYRGFRTTLPHMEALYVAANEQELATACVDLLRHPALAQSLAERGAEHVEGHYSYARIRHIVHGTVNEVVHASHRVRKKSPQRHPGGL